MSEDQKNHLIDLAQIAATLWVYGSAGSRIGGRQGQLVGLALATGVLVAGTRIKENRPTALSVGLLPATAVGHLLASESNEG